MKILVIDDDAEIRKFLRAGLRSECFEVDLAADGEEGLFLASTNEYDLIILDVNMPKKSGEEVCREIRAENKNVFILILSVLNGPISKADLLNLGADDFMSKPFSFKELLARVRALLRRSRWSTDGILSVGDVAIDTSGHTVTKDGKQIALTTKEFMLLEYLARNIDRAVSRGMILEHVWDMNADPYSNTIEVHVANLRRKIGDGSGADRLIRTVPGIGYKMVKKGS